MMARMMTILMRKEMMARMMTSHFKREENGRKKG
jgi:hypothetical protein